jgi:pilus assembly protein CpaE
MNNKLRTIVIFSDERFRKEFRYVLGKVEHARIEKEILHHQDLLSDELIEEASDVEPHVLMVDLPKERENFISILSQLHFQFPSLPIVAAGDCFDSALLIEAMRLGVKEFLPRPLTVESVDQAYQRLLKVFYGEAEKAPASIFSFFSSKGGSGSTTIATNFGVSLGKISKKKILIVDLDTQLGDVTDFFGIKTNKYLVQEDVNKSVLDPENIASTIVSHSNTGIDVLPLTDGFSRNARSLAGEIKHLLNFLQREYDYILVDTSNLLEDNTVAALDASNLIFLISKCSLPALRNSQRVLCAFDKLGYSKNKVRTVINRYSRAEDISVKHIEKALNFQVFWTIPNDYKSMIQSIQAGEPLTQKNQPIPLSKSFYEMSAKVLGIELDHKPKPPGGGLMIGSKEASAKSSPFTTLNLLKS